MRKIMLVICMLLMACIPGAKTTYKYKGDKKSKQPYVEVEKINALDRSSLFRANTYSLSAVTIVHNPLWIAFNVRVRCKFFLDKNLYTSICSKWFLLRPRVSIQLESFLHTVTIPYKKKTVIKLVCKLIYDNKEDNKSFSR